jgi:hypothetical protein
MDTTGHPRGVLQCRFIGSETPPDVDVTEVRLASLSARMPASTRWVTDAERAQDLAIRQRGAQLRRLW